MRISDCLQILRANWILLVVTTLLAVGVAGALEASKPAIYQSTVTLAVSACILVENSGSCDSVQGTRYAVERAKIYADLATTIPVLQAALVKEDSTGSVANLRSMVTATAISGTPVVEIRIDSPEESEVARLSESVSAALVEYAASAIDPPAENHNSATIKETNPSTPPEIVRSSSAPSIFLATILGLAAGGAMALGGYLFNRRLRSPGEAEALSRLDVLGVIPFASPRKRERDDTLASPLHVIDPLRRLRGAVLTRLAETGSRTLLITSTQKGERARDVAVGLAVSIAETGERVVLIDTDFAEKTLGGLLDLPKDSGLVEMARSDAEIGEFVQRVSSSSLYVLAAGIRESDQASPISSRHLISVFDRLREDYDYLIVLAPAMLPTAETVAILPAVDQVLIVARLRSVERRHFQEAVQTLALTGKYPIGIAITQEG